MFKSTTIDVSFVFLSIGIHTFCPSSLIFSFLLEGKQKLAFIGDQLLITEQTLEGLFYDEHVAVF